MLKSLVAAVVICVLALPAGAQSRRGNDGVERHAPRGQSQQRRRRGGHWYEAPDNPLGGFLGGILGGWLANQMRPTEPEEPFVPDDEGDDEEYRP